MTAAHSRWLRWATVLVLLTLGSIGTTAAPVQASEVSVDPQGKSPELKKDERA